jgi:Fur family peroxide stress response transcriptional regulator
VVGRARFLVLDNPVRSMNLEAMDLSAATLAAKMDELVVRCRSHGLSVTPQRMAIYRALLVAEDHPSPETLYGRVRTEMPSLSLATIYKVLDALVDLGLVHEVAAMSGTKRYEANLEKHHHLVCTQCGTIVDFNDRDLDAVVPPRRAPKLVGFIAETVSVQVMGVCARCSRGVPRRTGVAGRENKRL